MAEVSIDNLRTDLSIKSKNGLDFTLSAAIIWLLIARIWALDIKSYDKSVLTFIVGALMLPLTFLFSRIFRTTWTNKNNPLQPLGLWLNFSQLFYFPFLVFSLIKFPDYFAMIYAIITGAHFFPYSWFYKTNLYAVFAGIISVGVMTLGLILDIKQMYFVPLFISFSLVCLTILLFYDFKRKQSPD